MSARNAPRTGLAAITDGQGGFVLDSVTVRAPIGDEVRVAMGAAGVCHTDYASLSWDGPLVAGHEGAGWVEAIGPDVRDLAVARRFCSTGLYLVVSASNVKPGTQLSASVRTVLIL